MQWLVLAGLIAVGVGVVSVGVQRNRVDPAMEGTILANGGTPDVGTLSGEWRVTWIAFADLPPDVPILLRFAPGRVFGLAGCSNFEGTIAVTGNSFALGPVESDGTECSPEWMKAASDFLRVLSQSDRYEVAADGRLRLSGANIPTLEAAR